jgi:hypothetical protein
MDDGVARGIREATCAGDVGNVAQVEADGLVVGVGPVDVGGVVVTEAEPGGPSISSGAPWSARFSAGFSGGAVPDGGPRGVVGIVVSAVAGVLTSSGVSVDRLDDDETVPNRHDDGGSAPDLDHAEKWRM